MCFDAFTEEDKIYKLPCDHLFHADCIMPWLENHNTCPTCRKELPTDDLDHENRRRSNPNDPIAQFLNGAYRQPPSNGPGSGGNISQGGG